MFIFETQNLTECTPLYARVLYNVPNDYSQTRRCIIL